MNTDRILFAALLLMLAACTVKENKEVQVATAQTAEVVNDLPVMTLTMMDGSTKRAKEIEGSAIIILFQPDCDHCQREAQEIRKHIDAFKNYSLYFVSLATMTEVQDFAAKYDLTRIDNVRFGTTDMQSLADNFGSIPAPSFYIYNSTGNLVTKFNGETDINKILNAI